MCVCMGLLVILVLIGLGSGPSSRRVSLIPVLDLNTLWVLF